MGKTKEKTWMLIIETKSYRGLSCYRKVLFVSAPDHQVAKEKARDWCDGEQITSISIIPFDPNRMGDALIDSTEKNPLPEHPNIDTRWIAKYKTAEAFYNKYGHLRVKVKEDFDGVRLGVWIHKQRNDYRKNYSRRICSIISIFQRNYILWLFFINRNKFFISNFSISSIK